MGQLKNKKKSKPHLTLRRKELKEKKLVGLANERHP